VKAEFNVAGAVYNLLVSEVSDTEIKAPFDGVISERLVSVGQYITAGQPVTRLISMDPLEAEFYVPERYISQIKKGQKISFNSSSSPDAAISGEIFFIDPAMNESTRTVLVKASIPNPDFSFKPGFFGKLDVVLAEKANAIVIPESCVRYAGDQASVVVMNSEGKAEFRNVTVGQRMPGRVEIAEGLDAGERVVVEGYQKMGPGTGIIISPASEKYGVTPPPPAADSTQG
jgi:membrane fusion protein (multidrug efflux system)